MLSDPHVYDDSISEPGPAFDRSLRQGIETLAESRETLEAALAGIAAEKPDFLIVCGDLTKDGELASHRLAARILAGLKAIGIRVYVVPGNHDILNPYAARYVGDRVEKVETVTPEGFAAIYGELGYGEAFRRDPDSLSYAVEPVPGLWIIAIDDCRYRENRDAALSGGTIAPPTRAWVSRVLADARALGVTVMAFLHHGIVEQFRGEKTYLANSILDEYDEIAGLLARGGVKVAFTGHAHAQDITMRSFPRWEGMDFIYDVATGSTSSWPNPWRIVELDPSGQLGIRSNFVTSIAKDHPDDFSRYSERRLREGLTGIVDSLLKKLLVGEPDAGILARQVADAGLAFSRGDEKFVEKGFDLAGVGPWGAVIAEAASQALRDLQTDLPPEDNNVTLDLASGGPP